jgi:hypothetical protein
VNIVVFGPNMESRSLPAHALRPIAFEQLTEFERLVRDVGAHISTKDPVTIVGAPWVNPQGRGREKATVEEFLNQPLYLLRASVVAFLGRGGPYNADCVVVAADSESQGRVLTAREWVLARLTSPELEELEERIVWHVLTGGTEDAERQALSEVLRPLVK